MTNILFLDVEEPDREAVLKRFPNAAFAAASLSGEELVEACGRAEVICTFITTAFPRRVLEKLPALRLLCTRSVGWDHIDLDACRERGVIVCNVPDYGSHVIAEHVFALLLSTLRHVHAGHERVKAGRFEYRGLRGYALKGKTIGIAGTGKIGRRVARIAHGFGMKILATDQYRARELESELGVRYVALDELLAGSDVVTLHFPATEATRYLLDADSIAGMKDGAIVVNTARGSLIDTRALLDALDAGKLSRALLDVLENERDSEENKALARHPKVVVTPHIAFYTDDSVRDMYDDAFRSIEQWMAGEEPAHRAPPPDLGRDLPSMSS
jgi:D-lactate dehydrogenase